MCLDRCTVAATSVQNAWMVEPPEEARLPFPLLPQASCARVPQMGWQTCGGTRFLEDPGNPKREHRYIVGVLDVVDFVFRPELQ